MSFFKKFIRDLKKFFKISSAAPSRRKKTIRRKKSPLKKPKSLRKTKDRPKKIAPVKVAKKVTATSLPQSSSEPAGEITHYFSKIQVAVVKITKGELRVGDEIRIEGRSSNFSQKIQSMQMESIDVKLARRGQLIGLKVKKEASVGDKLYKIK